jgi:hypothetical protein
MATTPTIVVGRNNWGIKNGNLLGYYQSDDGFFVKREFAATRGGGTNGTFVGSNGFIQTAASGNLPRIDFYGGSPALLVEPAATNFAPNVNLMTGLDTPTVSGGVTLTTGSTDFLAPDGASGSINKYVGGAASGNTQNSRYGAASLIVTASGTYRFSLFVKAGTTNPLNFCAIAFSLFTGGSGTSSSFFNLASGTAITAGASIENYGDGWYRCISAPYTIASSDLSGTVYFNLASSSGSISWPASGALNLTAYTWGAQMEAGSVATSYVPTTTGSVTRNADVINLTGATDYIGQTEGTIYVEVDMQKTGVINAIFALDVGSSSEYIALIRTSSNQFRASIKKSSGTQQNIINSSSYPIGIYKVAFAYKNGDYALYVNGVQAGTSTNATDFPTGSLTQAVVSNTNYGPFNDLIITAALYNERLSNQELIEITS